MQPLSRRTFLRLVGAASGASLASGLLGSCNSGPTASSAQAVHVLWSDVTHVRAPLLDDFTRATGIKVNQTIVQYNQRLPKIQTAVQGGSDVDVVQMDIVWTARFAAAGWVQDVTSRITDAIKQDVPAAVLSAVTYHGKLYGMPLFNSAKHLFYNARLLKEVGFDHPPATLDEFIAQAKATTRPGQWGSLWSWKQSEALLCDWLSIMFTQPGAQLLDSHGKAVFHTMGGTEALQTMVDLLYHHHVADPASLESTEDDVRKMLQTGTYALTYNWEGVLPEANDPQKSQAAPHIRVALLPGGSGVTSASVNGAEGWAILTQSKRQEAAWKLLEYMASPAWQKKAALTAGDYPILASLYHDPELQQHMQDFAIYGEQFKYLVARPQLPDYAQKSDLIQRHLHMALLRQVSPREAMHAAASEVNRATATP
ncbi:MAG: extracellular solute-binding protein [Candidatus Tectomicrobia bacterium]|uniref:Extracellular solute-binding protein n=1 Tax=Tectimicrobiota bacterium TaxID=2528274 RepID=A0A937W0N9_UNCTE|nr:extracellular solute-binding protein [Candidatus Tectomicrobia bacterium]